MVKGGRVLSSAVLGMDARLVDVKVDIALGLPAFDTVSIQDMKVKGSHDRVKKSIENSGLEFPVKRIKVNVVELEQGNQERA